MRRFVLAFVCIAVMTEIVKAEDAALKERVRARSQAVVALLGSGIVTEGQDGLLKPVGLLDPAKAQLIREENQDRESVFAVVSEKSRVPLDEVRAMYATRARAKFPPGSAMTSGVGVCKLTPAKAPDALRLLQYLKQGMNYASQRKFDLALAEFQPALSIDRNFLALNQNIGAAQMGLKKYAEAEAAFKAEVKLTECLSGLSDTQLAEFGYFLEVEEKEPVKRRKAQAERLKVEVPRVRATAYYNLACVYSRLQQRADSLKALAKAVESGFVNRVAMTSDPDLTFVRATSEFKEIVSNVR